MRVGFDASIQRVNTVAIGVLTPKSNLIKRTCRAKKDSSDYSIAFLNIRAILDKRISGDVL